MLQEVKRTSVGAIHGSNFAKRICIEPPSTLRKALQAEQSRLTSEPQPRQHKPVNNVIKKLINDYAPKELFQIASKLYAESPSPKYLDSFYVLQDNQGTVYGEAGNYGTDWGGSAYRRGRHFIDAEHAQSEIKRLELSEDWQIVRVEAKYETVEPQQQKAAA